MNQSLKQMEGPITEESKTILRRQFLKGIGLAGLGVMGGSLLAGCGGSGTDIAGPNATDLNVLNFALNLEYLEAEYYLRATTGAGLNANDAGPGAGGVTGGRQVTFATPAIANYAAEIAADELAHVRFLRAALGSAAVSRPVINLQEAFNTAAQAAGIGPAFDPYADETSFLIGAFVFEDVGVTAYHGGAGLLTNKDILSAAAGILGTEAYHAGLVRGILYGIGGAAITNTQKISDLRAALGGGKDAGITSGGNSNIVPADENAITYARTTTEVLNIVYGNTNTTPGLFFPNGLNGNIH